MEGGIVAAILCMILVFALFPLLWWRRSQISRSLHEHEEQPQQQRAERVVQHSGTRRMRRRPVDASSSIASTSMQEPLAESDEEEIPDDDYYVAKASTKKEKKKQEREAQRQAEEAAREHRKTKQDRYEELRRRKDEEREAKELAMEEEALARKAKEEEATALEFEKWKGEFSVDAEGTTSETQEENQGLLNDFVEYIKMAPRGRGRSFQRRSGPDTEEHASDNMEDEIIDVTLDVTPPAAPGLRTMLHATGADRLSEPRATRKAVELLKMRWTEPWESWRDVPGDVREFLWDQFMGLYTCPDDERALLRRTWEAALQRRMTAILSQARTAAERASGSGDRSTWGPHRPGWMQARVWEELIRRWSTAEWAARSEAARRNRLTEKEGGVTKHTSGSIPFITHRERMAKSTGTAPSQIELFRRTHMKKGTNEFIDERSRKFTDDYTAALAMSGGSSSNPVDVDANAWMKAAGDSGRGRVYGYTAGESPGALSTAPSCSHARFAGASSSAQGGTNEEAMVSRITERICDRFESRFNDLYSILKNINPSSSHPSGEGGSSDGGRGEDGSGEGGRGKDGSGEGGPADDLH